MEFGLKIKTLETGLIDQAMQLLAAGQFHYLEIHFNPEKFDRWLETVAALQVSVVLHAPYRAEGLNISTHETTNKVVFEDLLNCADKVGAKYIIVHPGVEGTVEQAIEFLANYNDQRVIVENLPRYSLVNRSSLACWLPDRLYQAVKQPFRMLPGKARRSIRSAFTTGNKLACIGHIPQEIRQIKKACGAGFCLDFGHAYKAANSLGIEAKELIDDFMELDPQIFHVHDGDRNQPIDKHLNIGDGNYDLKHIYACIQQHDTQMLTFEVPRPDARSLEADLSSREHFISQGAIHAS